MRKNLAKWMCRRNTFLSEFRHDLVQIIGQLRKISPLLCRAGLPNIVLQYYCSLKIKIAGAYWAKIIIAAFCFAKK